MSFTVTSWSFLLLLASGRLLRGQNLVPYRYLFPALSAGVVSLAFAHWHDAAAFVSFLFLPYLYGKYFLPRFKLLSPVFVPLILAFIWFKGYSWILSSLGLQAYWTPFSLLGLSYVLFRVVDYLLQLEADTVTEPNLVDYLSFTLSYWTILSGPIERFHGFMAWQKNSVPEFDWPEFLRHSHRVANGLLKILILSSFCKEWSDTSFKALETGGGSARDFLVWLYAYPAYVYFNFSGYCDVVIALGALAGAKLPENFRRPYLARNVIEFWNRWHITLSEWLRDYLFQPLFKSFVTGKGQSFPAASQYLALFITFFVVGVWHGTTINFVIFGSLHGAAMVVAVAYRNGLKQWLGKEGVKRYHESRAWLAAAWLLCMNFICFSFLFFEYDIGSVLKVLGALGRRYVF